MQWAIRFLPHCSLFWDITHIGQCIRAPRPFHLLFFPSTHIRKLGEGCRVLVNNILASIYRNVFCKDGWVGRRDALQRQVLYTKLHFGSALSSGMLWEQRCATCVTLVIRCKRSGFIWTRERQHGTRSIFTASRNVSKSKKLGLGYC